MTRRRLVAFAYASAAAIAVLAWLVAHVPRWAEAAHENAEPDEPNTEGAPQ